MICLDESLNYSILLCSVSDHPEYGLVLYQYRAEEPIELSVGVGDQVVVVPTDQQSDHWCYVRQVNSLREGWVPRAYVQFGM